MRFNMWRLQWVSPRDLTNPWTMRIGRGCDEYHNRSVYAVCPIGKFVFFWEPRFERDREHLSGWGPEGGPHGYHDSRCDICTEIYDDFMAGYH